MLSIKMLKHINNHIYMAQQLVRLYSIYTPSIHNTQDKVFLDNYYTVEDKEPNKTSTSQMEMRQTFLQKKKKKKPAIVGKQMIRTVPKSTVEDCFWHKLYQSNHWRFLLVVLLINSVNPTIGIFCRTFVLFLSVSIGLMLLYWVTPSRYKTRK